MESLQFAPTSLRLRTLPRIDCHLAKLQHGHLKAKEKNGLLALGMLTLADWGTHTLIHIITYSLVLPLLPSYLYTDSA